MKQRIVVVGKPALSFAKNGIELYLQRLRRHQPTELVVVRDGSPAQTTSRLLEASENSFRVVVDERGKTPTTREFANLHKDWMERPDIRTVSYLIGPSDGHSKEVRAAADYKLALSNFVLQHELATLMLAEQLYRVATIHIDSPYHRD